MKVLLAAPRGFCAGVNMAIESLEMALRAFEAPIYVYHEIVHNRYVVDTFQRRGVVFVEDLEQAREDQDFGDLLEYRNELTGNVFDFYPISITEDLQIEAYTGEGEPLGGDPVNIKQLGVEDRIALINLIEEHGRA